MAADDMLDQDRWQPPVDLAHLLVEHGAAVAELRQCRLSVDQQIRSTALQAAATWLAGESFTHPERRELLTVASALAGWIRTGQAVDPNPRPVSPLTRQEATPT